MKSLLIILLAQSLLPTRGRARPHDVIEPADATVAASTEAAAPRPHAPAEPEPAPAVGRPEPAVDWTLVFVRLVGVVVSIVAVWLVVRKLLRLRNDGAIPASDDLMKAARGPLRVIRPPGTLGRRESVAVVAPDAGTEQTDAPSGPTVPEPPPPAQEPAGGWDESVVRAAPIGDSPASRAAAATEIHIASLWSQVHVALGHDRTHIAFHEGLGVWRAWADAPTYEQAVCKGESRTKLGAVRILRIVAGGTSRPARESASSACRPSTRHDLGDTWTAWATNRGGGAAHAYRAPPEPTKAARSR